MDARTPLADEERTWAAFTAALAEVDPARRTEPTVTPGGWSVQTVLAHTAAWLDDCGRVLELMAAGTWDPATDPGEQPGYVDRVNAEHADRAAAMTWSEAEHLCAAARDRARRALEALPSIDADALTWFEESGPRHELKHLHDLRAWLAGVPSDPAVGQLLEAESEAWIGFAQAIDGVGDPRQPGPDGWTTTDATHHLVRWLDRAIEGIGRNVGLPPSEVSMDDLNDGFLAESASVRFADARATLDDRRLQVRLALAGLAAPSAAAMEAFVGDTTEHYEEHLGSLQALADGRGR